MFHTVHIIMKTTTQSFLLLSAIVLICCHRDTPTAPVHQSSSSQQAEKISFHPTAPQDQRPEKQASSEQQLDGKTATPEPDWDIDLSAHLSDERPEKQIELDTKISQKAPRYSTGTKAVGISKEDVRRPIRRHFNQIRHCYESSDNTRTLLSHRSVVSFTIQADGSVAQATVEMPLENPEFETCMSDTITKIRFPPLRNGVKQVVVSYPFNINWVD